MSAPEIILQKILVIDDDAVIRMVLRNLLKSRGFEFFEATNGVEGVAQFKRENPDLVITDMLMPNKEGLETIMEIRAHRPSVKIIAMSGGGNTQNMSFLEMAKKVGADAVVAKPFGPQDILTHIKNMGVTKSF